MEIVYNTDDITLSNAYDFVGVPRIGEEELDVVFTVNVLYEDTEIMNTDSDSAETVYNTGG